MASADFFSFLTVLLLVGLLIWVFTSFNPKPIVVTDKEYVVNNPYQGYWGGGWGRPWGWGRPGWRRGRRWGWW